MWKLFTALQVGDAATTLPFAHLELNPIALAAFATIGIIPAIILFKLFLISLAYHAPTKVVTAGVIVTALIVLSNLTVLL